MKLAHLTPSFLPIIGGTEFYIAGLASKLEKHGIPSEIISLSYNKKNETVKTLKQDHIYGINRIVWPSRYLGILRFPLKTHFLPLQREILRRHLNKFDVIHIHDDVDLSFPLVTTKVKRPKLFTCHSLPYWREYFSLNPFARKLFKSSADLYHVFSNRDMRFLLRIGVPKEKIIVVPHGVDIKTYRPWNSRITKNSIDIGFLGRISPQKGILNLMKSIKELNENYTSNLPIKVSIAGPIADVKYYNTLIKYRRAKHLHNIVFTGQVADTRRFLQNLDVFVFSSRVETFGLTLLEAMACGLPVIATNIPPLSEIVINGKTGFTVTPNDPKSLAEKLNRLIKEKKLRKKMGSAGRKRVEEFYSMERITREMIKRYTDLI
jgi:glycosyltransferase involved in cell wall biosynthesis